MKKTILWTILALLLPVTQAWGDTSTHYYAQLKAQVATAWSGCGTVYAGTSTSVGTGTFGAESTSDTQDSTNSAGGKKTFYAFAKPEANYEFDKWEASGATVTATEAYGTDGSRATVTVAASSTANGIATGTVTAYFKKKVLPAFNITFKTSDSGDYTVDGAAPADKTGLTESTKVTLATSDPNFLNWMVNGSVVNGNPYTASFGANTTISAVFLTADQVTSVATIDELTAALANETYKKVVIPTGTTNVLEGGTIAVPEGKQLVVDGTLWVEGGTLTGTVVANGTLSKCTKRVVQQGQSEGVPFNPYGDKKYWKTSVSTPTITLPSGVAAKNHATVVNGSGEIFRIVIPDSARVLTVKRDAAIAENHISGVSSVSTSDEIKNVSSGAMFVLLTSDCVINKNVTAKTGFSGYVDCAGNKCSTGSSYEVNGNNGAATFFNCPEFTVTKSVGTTHTFYNCQKVTVKSLNAGNDCKNNFYDCGPTVSISYNKGPSTGTCANFYSGTYDSIPSKSQVIYGGSYKTNPGTEGAYLATGKSLRVKQEGGYYVVYEHIAVNAAEIDTGSGIETFETLQAAFDKIGNGQTVRLVQNYEGNETATIAAGKNFSLELGGYSLLSTSGKIVNNGTLWIKDSATLDATKETSEVNWAIENNGTLEITYGAYKGNFTLDAESRLIMHGGRFLNQLILGNGVTDPTAVADLRGGYFNMDLATAGFLSQDYLQKSNWVGKFPYALVENTTQSGYEKVWKVTALPSADLAIYAKNQVVRPLPRAEYGSDADWNRRAELESMLKPYSGTIDCTLSFDRPTEKDSVKVYVYAKTSSNVTLDHTMAANEVYRVLITTMLGYGSTYSLFGYDRFLTGYEFTQTATVGVADVDGANPGTVAKLELEVCHTSNRNANPQTPDLYVKDFAVATCRYMLGGKKAAIDRESSRVAYDSLAAAVADVQSGERILVGADTVDNVTLVKAGTFTIDPYGFAFTGTVTIGDRFFLKAPASTTTSLAAAQGVSSADATTYVVAQKVAQVGAVFYDNLNEAITAANGAVVTLLAATDEPVSLAENASFTLALADGVTFSDSQVAGADGCLVQKEAVTGGTLYKAVKDVIETEGGTSYTSVMDAIAGETGDEISITVKANVTEEVEVPQGKTVKITVAEGVEPTLTVNPGEGAFLVETKEGATTMYEAKRITETPVTPTDDVIAKEVSGGDTNDVMDASALVTRLVGNAAIERVDNTTVAALDKIEVTPTTIIAVKTGEQDVIESATFEVTPKAKEGQTFGETMLKFRLPVDAKTDKVNAKVNHDGAFFGVLPIRSEMLGETVCKFVEVTSNAFSPYGYELLSGATDPVAIIDSVGYATLAEAVAAVQDGQTIVLLKSCVAKGPSYANKGTITFTAANEDVVLDISDMTGPVSAAGTSLVFKNMTLNGFRKGASWYNGWQGAGESYEGCTINGCTTLYSPNVTFKDCVFNNTENEYSLYDYGADKLVLDGCTFNCAGKAIKVYNEGARAFDVFATNTTFNASEVRKAAFQLDVNYGITANIVVDQSCALAGTGYTTGVEGGDPWVYSENEPATSTPETARGQFALGTNIVRDENGKITGGTFERISAGLIAEGFEGKPDPTTGKIVVEEIPVTEILTAADVVAFSAAVNGGKTFEGEKVVLTADIDMTDVAFTPIGNVAAYPSITFKGTFDGQNHKISNLKASDFTPNYATAGLFGSLGKGAVVQNLTLVDPEIESSHYAGAIVGYISEGPVKVINCSVEGGSVMSTPELIGGEYDNGDKVGGILGYGAGTGNEITDCSISDMTITAYRDIGGIAGCANASLNGNSVSDTTIVQDNTYAYKGEMITTVSEICGRDTGAPAPTVENETSEVEIVRFNPVAKVGGVGYETLQAALDAAQAGDTVTLLRDIEGVTETFEITEAITIDGSGHKIVAAANETPRDMITAYMGARVMFLTRAAEGVTVTFRNLTADGGATHYYTFLAETKGGVFTVENTQWMHGGEASAGDVAGVGYGAAIHVNGGNLFVNGTFRACTGGKEAGVFPFTGILYDDGGIHFDDEATATIGDDLLLVGMTGAPDVSTEEGKAYVEELLAEMNVPAGFAPYTLKLGDDSSLAFTGASPLGWNDIIDYGKQIMDVAAEAMGFEDLDKETTPVEVGLLADTELTEAFAFEDSNLTVNGNGNALSGTITYTDEAGQIANVELGTEEKPLILDMTEVTKPVQLGDAIVVNDLIIKMTPEQAVAGTPVVTWPTEEGVEAPANEEGVKVQLFDPETKEPVVTEEPVELIWDNEMGLAYIGPVEARLTGPDREQPLYTSLAEAIAQAENGETVTLMMDIENFTGTVEIEKSLTFDGANHKIVAKPVTTHRDIFNAYVQSSSMLKLKTGAVTLKNITLDGDASHAYTYLVSADNSSVSLTTENVRLVNGGELMGDENGEAVGEGAGYGAAVHLNNGATMVVRDGFTACTGGTEDGVFPFTGILVDSNGANVKFDLTEDSNANPTVGIGGDLLLVGMPVAIDAETAQGILDEMKVPTRFVPYTLTLGDGTDYAFTGASPLGWNEIIEYGKEIMDASAAMGYEGLDKATTPVEVGLLTDTVLVDTFKFEDSNFTVNGNGNALSGTIEYTDEAGQIENVELGTEEKPLVLDMTKVENPVHLGDGIKVTDLVIKMTPEQATAGTPVVTWTSDAAAPEGEDEVKVQLIDPETDQPVETEEPVELIWDEELHIAYIGPVEARLTGPTHPEPIYTSLAEAIRQAAQSGDTVTLMMDIENFTGTVELEKSLIFDGNGHKIVAKPVTTHRDIFNAYIQSRSMLKLKTGTFTLRDITLDGDASHAYTYLVSADNSGVSLTTENVRLVNGGELMGDENGAAKADGAGYGAAVHLNNGATMVVKDGFYACTGGTTDGVFPFTGILVDSNGANVSFDLTTDSNETPTVGIGDDLLLVGMPVAIDAETAQGILDAMKVPTRFIPYTLTLGDGSAYAFTGASPLGWNDIIDYGKQIMEVSTAIGFEGLDTEETPVEVGLLTDTVLPDEFVFEDSNFTVNGNGNALSGTIEYTDNAGLIENIELGTEEQPLVLDMTEVTKPVQLGDGIEVTDLVIKMTPEQAKAGTPVVTWTSDAEAPANEEGVTVALVDPESSEPTGETKDLIWDVEMHLAYIGPAEVRLTGPTHVQPLYTTLVDALAAAKDDDAIKLLEDVALTDGVTFDMNVTLDLAGKEIGGESAAMTVGEGKTLTINDGSEEGAGVVASVLVNDGGKLVITSGTFEKSISASEKVTVPTAAFALSGGTYSEDAIHLAGDDTVPLNDVCVEGYEAVYNGNNTWSVVPDRDTVAFEPKSDDPDRIEVTFGEGTGTKIPVVVSDAWVRENFEGYYGTEATKPAAAEINAKLDEKQENGMKVWQNYLLGFDGSETAKPLSPDGGDSEDKENVIVKSFRPVTLPKLDMGVTVSFVLLKGTPTRNAAGEIVSWKWDEVQTLDKPEFPVALTTLEAETYWRIKTVFRANKVVVHEETAN